MNEMNDLNENSRTGPLLTFLFCFYLFFCFFEPYFNAFSTVGKYVIFIVIIAFLLSYGKLKFEWYHLSIVLWFLLKVASILWTSLNDIVLVHFYSQIGMLALFITMTLVTFSNGFVKSILATLLYSSFLIGILSLFYSEPFLSDAFSDRQVLTLLGAQNDPNDQAAFLLVGIAIALNGLLNGKVKKIFKYIVLLAIMIVNTYAIFITGSRGGFVSVIILTLAAALLTGDEKKPVMLKLARNIGLLGLFFVGLYVVANSYLSVDTFNRIFDFNSYLGGSGRYEIWKNTLQIFLNDPVIGGGWGSYWGYNGYYSAVHNTFLSVLADGGIIGFLLLFLPIFVIGLKSLKQGQVMPFLIFIAGFAPSIFLDAINKRFFWNALIVALILINNQLYNDKNIKSQNLF